MRFPCDTGGTALLRRAEVIDFNKLKSEALASPKRRSRVILEPGFDMVICLHRESYVRMHRHPRYEAYHVIEGALLVAYMDIMRRHSTRNPFVQLPPMTWHSPSADGEFVIYREFYCGPFEKDRDVEYAPGFAEEAA